VDCAVKAAFERPIAVPAHAAAEIKKALPILGAAGGVAADIDERSLERGRGNLGPFPILQVMRAGAYDLVFEDRFDFAFSIGVIHHLGAPGAGHSKGSRWRSDCCAK